jgi:hypothetical protein
LAGHCCQGEKSLSISRRKDIDIERKKHDVTTQCRVSPSQLLTIPPDLTPQNSRSPPENSFKLESSGSPKSFRQWWNVSKRKSELKNASRPVLELMPDTTMGLTPKHGMRPW